MVGKKIFSSCSIGKDLELFEFQLYSFFVLLASELLITQFKIHPQTQHVFCLAWGMCLGDSKESLAPVVLAGMVCAPTVWWDHSGTDPLLHVDVAAKADEPAYRLLGGGFCASCPAAIQSMFFRRRGHWLEGSRILWAQCQINLACCTCICSSCATDVYSGPLVCQRAILF